MCILLTKKQKGCEFWCVGGRKNMGRDEDWEIRIYCMKKNLLAMKFFSKKWKKFSEFPDIIDHASFVNSITCLVMTP